MKKLMITLSLVLCGLIVSSFLGNENNKDEVVISITAESETIFDMSQNSKTTRGLRTPHEFKMNANDGKLIFKSQNGKSRLNIKVVSDEATLEADWPVTVVIIDGGKWSTFGMD
ncbi:MAG: hypothetical protein HC811_04830 [Flammeovirgaceae bacterium]|nr:hypothetical protein [Flammeovirgaceae bacterium]